jgi:uncharacterized protein
MDATAHDLSRYRRDGARRPPPLARLRAHLWTVWPRVRHSLRPLATPAEEPWKAVVDDPVMGPVRLSGRLRRAAAGQELVVMVHGLGGSIDSHYMVRGALAAEAAGLAYLRLNLRGADLSGDDFYHAGLTADLHAALASPELRRYERIYLLGYSLGGHLVLRFATEACDPRVVRVAAVCSPLDLGLSQQGIDRPGGWPYRRYLLPKLARVYAAFAARRPVSLPAAVVARLRKIRDFDERVVAPRHGFTGAADYYARASVAPRLAALRLPALLVNAECDPMVLADAVRPVLDRPALDRPPERLEVRWLAEGGHVSFPRGLDLALEPEGRRTAGDAGPRSAGRGAGRLRVDDQVLAWLRRP